MKESSAPASIERGARPSRAQQPDHVNKDPNSAASADMDFPAPGDAHAPIFLAGPTAVGKSAVALALAEKIGGEIISVDSMQVYRGLDIGTAKPTAEEWHKIPHHLIDVCDLSEPFDAAKFVRVAARAVAGIQSRGRTPIFCGGTGLYFQAFLEGLGEGPPASEKLRTELASMPLEQLLAELRERDPAAFEKIDRQNPRRVIRAVEVIRLTGKKFSEQQSRWGERPREPLLSGDNGSRGRSPHRFIVCLARQPADLHRRINARVEEMFARGLVPETRELLQHGLAENKTAMQALGYRQVVEHLRGERGLADTIELVKIKTRQFAKRQLTWFRRYGNCRWIELPTAEPVSETVAQIISPAIPTSPGSDKPAA
jgi:tRNA dimethylallyltransferase